MVLRSTTVTSYCWTDGQILAASQYRFDSVWYNIVGLYIAEHGTVDLALSWRTNSNFCRQRKRKRKTLFVQYNIRFLCKWHTLWNKQRWNISIAIKNYCHFDGNSTLTFVATRENGFIPKCSEFSFKQINIVWVLFSIWYR